MSQRFYWVPFSKSSTPFLWTSSFACDFDIRQTATRRLTKGLIEDMITLRRSKGECIVTIVKTDNHADTETNLRRGIARRRRGYGRRRSEKPHRFASRQSLSRRKKSCAARDFILP